ncbi:MAG: helix-turn-helix domain-containing protein [Proteobacteria bacterium]|nr:helix-turn-helix domain-containing protein [Pseudomonadota bacterium]
MNHADLMALAKIPLFADLPIAKLDELEEKSFVQQQPSEAVLFEQGDSARFLCVILSGRVALVGSSKAPAEDLQEEHTKDEAGCAGHDREAIIEIFGPNEVVTIAAIVLNLPYLMSARVLEAARIALIPADIIRDLLQDDASFARATTVMLAKHWRLLSRQLKDQKLRSGTQRLGTYLLTLTEGRMSGPADIALPLDRRTMASWLGMSVENLSRSLAQLKPIGVTANGRAAHINDIAQVRAFCLEDGLR